MRISAPISALALAFASAVCLTAPAFAGGGGGGGGSGSGSSAGNRIQASFTIGEDGTISTGSGNSGGHGAPADDGHGAPADDGHGAPSGGHGEEVSNDNPRLVTLPTLVVPLSRDNHLTGYGFVTVRFIVASGFDHWDIREHAHFALDRLIRSSHSNSIATADGLAIDPVRAEEVWREALSAEFGEGVVDTLSFEVPDIRRVGR